MITLLLAIPAVFTALVFYLSGAYWRLGLDAFVGNVAGGDASEYFYRLFNVIVPVVLFAWIAVPIDRVMRRRAEGRPIDSAVGQPVVVGHTADGQAVYAPVHGASSQRTNTYAIVALVLGVAGGLLAIPFGHIALSQINRTGEQGRGMAIAGLVLGYLSLVAVIAMVLLVAVAASQGGF